MPVPGDAFMTGHMVQLGSGRKARSGWITLDISAEHSPHVVADLSVTWPFKNSCVSRFEVEHVLEHLPDPAHFISECFRTLLPGGEAEVTVPHNRSLFSVADPTHVRFFNGLSLDYYAVPGRARRLSGTYGHGLRVFELMSRRYLLGGVLGVPVWRLLGVEWLARRFPLAFEKWFAGLPFGGCDVRWVIRKPDGA